MQLNQAEWNNMPLVCGTVTISALSLHCVLHVGTDWRDLYNLGAREKEQTPFYCFKSLFPLWAPCDKFSVFIIGSLCRRLSQFPHNPGNHSPWNPTSLKNPQICFLVTRHGSLIMASILPGSIIHYPFLKINPKHFNFDTAAVWPELHCVPIFLSEWYTDVQDLFYKHSHLLSCTYYPRTNSLHFILLLQCSKSQNSMQIQWT